MPLAFPLSSLHRFPASCQGARIFVFLEGLGLRLSTSATGGETQVFSSMRKRAGRSAFQGASASSREGSARLPRVAGVCPPPESRRGGEQVCSAASSITAKERPRFLRTPPYLPQTALLSAASAPACRGGCAVRRYRSPQTLRP